MFPVIPMKAALGSLPADDDRWAYEIKFDGYRTIAHIDDGRLWLQSISGIDVTARYPELTELPTALNASTAVLDGELVALDTDGHPRFDLIQRHDRPAALYVFDVLAIDGTDTTGLEYLDRRRLLAQLIEPGDHHLVPGYRVGGGQELFTATVAAGLEGIMAKRVDSTYLAGKRSPNWRKIKHRRFHTATIGGFTAGSGNRASTFGALLVGRPDRDGALVFQGGIGTGFDQLTLERLTIALRELEQESCPFDPPPTGTQYRDARWVHPVLSATIEMTELTNDGLIRHGSFVGLVDPDT